MRFDQPLDDAFRNRSHVRVLRALHNLPRGMAVSARDVARRADLSHPTASAALRSLADQGLVHARHFPRIQLFALNDAHILIPLFRQLFDTEARLHDRLVAFVRDQLKTRAPTVTAAFLFGSVAWGGMTPTSDIDAAFVSPGGEADTVTRAVEEIADEVERRFGNHLNGLVTTLPLQQLLNPGRKSNRLWKRIVDAGIPLFTEGARV